jgi:hypothetical protein
MPEIDLGPNKYRQVSADEMKRARGRLEPQPVLTPHGPAILAVLFCLGFGFWLLKGELTVIVNWLATLLGAH